MKYDVFISHSSKDLELSEKICDYFEKLELKTGKSFDKYVESYLKDLDSIIERRITYKAKASIAGLILAM